MRGTRLAAVGGCCALTSFAWLPGAAAATTPRLPAAAPVCTDKPGAPASEMKVEPWAQQKLNFTDAWKQTRGEGVTVAVIDSGVDADHVQLRNVRRSVDVTGTGLQDCLGHGTQVAGIIGAQDLRPTRGIPFYGVAPGATLISVKMAIDGQGDPPEFIARAINEAVKLGADVINVSAQAKDTPNLRSAVANAQRKDAVIVAAAGNLEPEEGQTREAPIAYPAGYEGVISVGAIKPDGTLAQEFSNPKTPVTVTAPGEQIVSTFPGGTYNIESGTSFATPYVAGTAALVRANNPQFNYRQVIRAIQGTADGGTLAGTGSGLVNPLRAVNAIVSAQEGAQASRPPRPVTIMQPEPEDRLGRILALSIAGAGLAIAAVVAVIGVVIPAGRRRGWRADRRNASPPPAA